jgi:GNAT superfamily N-acetyltransferase
MNIQLSADEGGQIGPLSAYVSRMRDWLENDRYQAAVARLGDDVLGYVLWRDDPDYGDIDVRQFFVSRQQRGAGLGQALFEREVCQLWPGRRLRLDVYDSNPRSRAFWEKAGFAPYSRLMAKRMSPGMRRRPAS